ncbi:hypothetical protein JHK87_025599 [Glycine soja]|nr:hypothetical protein JHK87_025599 [Glycine soja]
MALNCINISTGRLYVKSDVYGFGVVLLEILTGMRTFGRKQPTGQQNLLKTIMDAMIDSQYSPKAAFQAAQLILKCLEHDPKQRPSMEEVLEGLKAIEAIHEKSKESKTSNSYQLPRETVVRV